MRRERGAEQRGAEIPKVPAPVGDSDLAGIGGCTARVGAVMRRPGAVSACRIPRRSHRHGGRVRHGEVAPRSSGEARGGRGGGAGRGRGARGADPRLIVIRPGPRDSGRRSAPPRVPAHPGTKYPPRRDRGEHRNAGRGCARTGPGGDAGTRPPPGTTAGLDQRPLQSGVAGKHAQRLGTCRDAPAGYQHGNSMPRCRISHTTAAGPAGGGGSTARDWQYLSSA